MPRKRFGDLLLEYGLTEEQLAKALERQEETGERLGDAVIRLGYMTASEMADLLSEHLRVPRVDWESANISREMAGVLPESLLKENRVFPVGFAGSTLILAMVDPFDVVTIDEIRNITGFEVSARLATADEIEAAVSRVLDLETAAWQEIDELAASRPEEQDPEEDVEVLDAPGAKIVDLMLPRAVRARASDIHIEPREKAVRVRFRIDGVLRDVMQIPKHLQSDVITRLKVLAEMDITERRIPQDGRIRRTIAKQPVDMRISSLPTIYGEKIVIRLFNQTSLLRLEQLGFLPEAYQPVRVMLEQPQGLILLTGPTGSGKTTTLYAFLRELNSPEKNIITIEDPVEYRLEGINQVQVNPQVGLTFASGLRSVLRQDPDIVMVGEMRDRETAEIGIRAALTGHLVLSTLHTNSAVATLTRLLDMGIDPALIAATLNGVVAQRLVRTICRHCKEKYRISDPARYDFFGDELVGRTLYRGSGCRECGYTGYRGRMAIEEVLLVTPTIRRAIHDRCSEDHILSLARKEGMKTLRRSGLEKVLAGKTTLDEVMRSVYGLEDPEIGID